MKRIALFLVIVLSFARAASAANGTVGASTSDAVTISVSGGDFQNVHWEVRTAGTSKLTTEYTTDGVNWLPAAYTTQATVSANPPTAAWQNTTAVAGSFDTPISGNTSGFRVRCGTTGTSTVLTLVAGKDYEPGVPMVATIYDVSAAFGVAIDTGTLDVSGWSALGFYFLNADTGGVSRVWGIGPVVDDGVTFNQNQTTVNSGSGSYAQLVTQSWAVFGNMAQIPRRLRSQVAAGTGTGGSSRLVILARR